MDCMGFAAFNLLYNKMKERVATQEAKIDPSDRIQSKSDKFHELFTMKVVGVQKDKYYAKKLSTAILEAFERNYFLESQARKRFTKCRKTIKLCISPHCRVCILSPHCRVCKLILNFKH